MKAGVIGVGNMGSKYAVIVATPHYSHEQIAARAFADHLHVLSDKPSGVYSRQARQMEEAAADVLMGQALYS